MAEALLFGLIASSPLVFGSVLGTRVRLPKKVLASALAFASGSLITALAFELFIDSFEQGGAWISGLGMLAGAAVFVTISSWLDRRVEHPADPAGSPKMDTAAATQEPDFSPSAAGSAAGLALLAAAVLDGAPENLALGITLAEEGGGLVLLAAIFLQQLPGGARRSRVVAGVGALVAVRHPDLVSDGGGPRAGRAHREGAARRLLSRDDLDSPGFRGRSSHRLFGRHSHARGV